MWKDFERRVVDDVQHSLHDDFIAVSWPRCPRIVNIRSGTRMLVATSHSGEPIAELGNLASTQPNIE